MTSRERIRNLLAGKSVDKIPFGLGACETAGCHVLVYDKLKDIIGLNSNKNRMYTFMTNSVAELEFLEKVGGDIVNLNSKMCPSPLWGDNVEAYWKEIELFQKNIQIPVDWKFVALEDGSVLWENINWKCSKNALYFDPIETVNINDVDLDDILPESYNPPNELPESYLRSLENQAKWLYDNTDLAISCGETINDLQVSPGGFEVWWMYLAAEPEKAKEFLEKACESGLSQLKQLDQAIGKYCDILGVAHDFGDTRGVIIGPQKWREIYKPIYKKYFSGWKNITNMKINLHSCGAINDILPDLVECGVQILNPVQVSANNMNVEKLKRDYGNDIIFLGGSYDSVQNMSNCTYDEVYLNVKNNISALSKGGGYIFAGVHNISGEVPREHLEAMLDAYNDLKYNEELLQK